MNKKILIIVLSLFFMPGISMADEFGDVDIHGFIAQGYLQTNKNNFYSNSQEGTFEFNEAGINFTARLSPKLRIGLQLFARDIGPYGNDEVTLDWVYGDYRYQRWLGLRFGKIRIPLSLYSETRDMDNLRTWVFLPQGVYHEIRRDTFSSRNGIELYGSLPRNIFGTFSYRTQVGVLSMKPDDGNSTFVEALVYPVWTVQSIEPKTSYLVRIDWDTPLDGLHLYTTYSEYESHLVSRWSDDMLAQFALFDPTFDPATDSEFENDITDTAWYYGVEYTIRDLVLAAEFFKEKSLQNIPGYFIEDFWRHREGFYFSGSYRFSEWFEAGVYYSEYDGDPEGEEFARKPFPEPKNKYLSEEYCLSFRFDITPNWIFKLEGHKYDGFGVLIDQDQLNLSDDKKTIDNWSLMTAKISYYF